MLVTRSLPLGHGQTLFQSTTCLTGPAFGSGQQCGFAQCVRQIVLKTTGQPNAGFRNAASSAKQLPSLRGLFVSKLFCPQPKRRGLPRQAGDDVSVLDARITGDIEEAEEPSNYRTLVDEIDQLGEPGFIKAEIVFGTRRDGSEEEFCCLPKRFSK